MTDADGVVLYDGKKLISHYTEFERFLSHHLVVMRNKLREDSDVMFSFGVTNYSDGSIQTELF